MAQRLSRGQEIFLEVCRRLSQDSESGYWSVRKILAQTELIIHRAESKTNDPKKFIYDKLNWAVDNGWLSLNSKDKYKTMAKCNKQIACLPRTALLAREERYKARERRLANNVVVPTIDNTLLNSSIYTGGGSYLLGLGTGPNTDQESESVSSISSSLLASNISIPYVNNVESIGQYRDKTENKIHELEEHIKKLRKEIQELQKGKKLYFDTIESLNRNNDKLRIEQKCLKEELHKAQTNANAKREVLLPNTIDITEASDLLGKLYAQLFNVNFNGRDDILATVSQLGSVITARH